MDLGVWLWPPLENIRTIHADENQPALDKSEPKPTLTTITTRGPILGNIIRVYYSKRNDTYTLSLHKDNVRLIRISECVSRDDIVLLTRLIAAKYNVDADHVIKYFE